MNKWYKSGLTKGILIVLQHVLVVMAVISIVWIAVYPGLAQDMLSGERAKTYDSSEAFGRQVSYDSQSILSAIGYREALGMDGELDEKKVVDIEEYYNNATISGKDESGLTYYLGDLIKWKESYDKGEVNSSDVTYAYEGMKDPVIVCQKTDGTYDYYYYSEFIAKLEGGELSFIMEGDDLSRSELLDMLKRGDISQGAWNSAYSVIQDEDGQAKYVDCWNYDGYWMEEAYRPIGAESLLDIVNENPNWNGRLSEAYSHISVVMSGIGDMVNQYRNNKEEWQEGDTNLIYFYADLDAKKIYTNKEQYQSYDKLEETLKSMKSLGRYVIVKPKLADFDSNINGAKASEWKSVVKELGTTKDNYIYAVGIDTSYPIQDEYHDQDELYHKYAPQIRMMVVLGGLSVILFLGIMVWLTVAAGRNNKDDELHLHPFDKWKTEIAAAAVFIPWFFLTFMVVNVTDYQLYRVNSDHSVYYYPASLDMMNNVSQIIVYGVIAVITCALFMVGFLSLVRRIKARSLWKNSLVKWLIDFLKIVFGNIHSIWQTALLFGGFVLIHWIAMAAYGTGFFTLLMFAAEAAGGIYLIRRAIGRQRIRSGIERIAGGEVDYKIPLDGLRGEQLMIADRVNTIGSGLDAAVEASMKNERLKTDLITNVSHDIKTPLTSIINYVDLLKRENFEDPKIRGYLDVLEAKAQRLKTLTEDVVEASKVSSGNITLEFMNINLVEMIQQTSGEFEEKFKNRNLTEILSLPEDEAVIRVDGRRMWRVLENIYNNAAKYAMEGTRVYADLHIRETTVVFSLKNVSDQPLNINADELTERFIRGDVSRSTEGSGLGLSIAKTLTEMQGGKFELYLDGDLFRVTITFPRMVKPPVMNEEQ